MFKKKWKFSLREGVSVEAKKNKFTSYFNLLGYPKQLFNFSLFSCTNTIEDLKPYIQYY